MPALALAAGGAWGARRKNLGAGLARGISVGLTGPAALDEGSGGTHSLASPTDPSAVDAGSLRYSFALSAAGLAANYAAASTPNSFAPTFADSGSVTIYGAPEGSITVEAWQKGEVEITADIEQSAGTEEELTRLAAVNGFVLDEDVNHLRLMTVGVHDRKYVKRVARDLPKNLLAMPWKIDYHLRVPSSCDLEIYSGRGALSISGVEGALRVNAGEGGATFTLAGGDVEATLKGGPVRVRVLARSWRGQGMSVRLASGDLTVELPAGFSGDINAEVLNAGRVENAYAGLAPREHTETTDAQPSAVCLLLSLWTSRAPTAMLPGRRAQT